MQFSLHTKGGDEIDGLWWASCQAVGRSFTHAGCYANGTTRLGVTRHESKRVRHNRESNSRDSSVVVEAKQIRCPNICHELKQARLLSKESSKIWEHYDHTIVRATDQDQIRKVCISGLTSSAKVDTQGSEANRDTREGEERGWLWQSFSCEELQAAVGVSVDHH